MKRTYEIPRIYCEAFTPNRAIAACGDQVDRDIIFDCMIGPNRDVESVVTDSCTRKAATTTYKTAWASNSHSHSDVTGGTWGQSGDYRTYTVPSGAIGLVYFCTATNGTSCFTVDTDNARITHSQNHGGQYHVEVAPLYGTSVEDVNVGS